MNIGWISVGNKDIGSTRIGVLNIHYNLLQRGFESTLLHLNPYYNNSLLANLDKIKDTILERDINLIVIHKVSGSKVMDLISFCKERGIKTIYATGDWYQNEMYYHVDHTLVGSQHALEAIQNIYGLSNVSYIEDAIETENYPIKQHIPKDFLALGWVGNYTKFSYAHNFINSLNVPKLFYSISNTPEGYPLQASIAMGAGTNESWDTDFLIRYLIKEIDVGVIPLEDTTSHEANAKTANRVTLFLSLGIPVIASAIDSYRKVIKNGENGFLCHTKQEWEEALKYFRSSESRTINAASIRSEYSLNKIAMKYHTLFKNVYLSNKI